MASERHLFRLYDDDDELADAVAAFVAEGLAGGDPVLLVVTARHRDLILARLDERRRLLRILDADELVAAGAPSAVAFERVVGGALDELAEQHPGRGIRVFGEAVDVLASRGEHEAAISLEELWNSLAWSRSFTLLCAYRRDCFDGEAGAAALAEVRRTHSHVVA